MDNATLLSVALSILSILITIAVAIIGFFFAIKIDKSKAEQQKILLELIQFQMMQNGMNKGKGGEALIDQQSKEKEEYQKRYEILQQIQQKLNKPASVLSPVNKVGERRKHA